MSSLIVHIPTVSRSCEYTKVHKNRLTVSPSLCCTDAPVVLSHVTAITSSDDEETQQQQEGDEEGDHLSCNSSPQQFTISSHDSFVSPDIEELWDVQPKSHADFEVPPFLESVLEQKGFTLGQSIGSGTYGKAS